MKHLLYIFLAFMAFSTMFSCKSKTSQHSAQAQMRAIKLADSIVAVDSCDTMAIQRAILKAEAVRSEYVIMGDSIAAHDFDEAYRTAVSQKRPGLATVIFVKDPK